MRQLILMSSSGVWLIEEPASGYLEEWQRVGREGGREGGTERGREEGDADWSCKSDVISASEHTPV